MEPVQEKFSFDSEDTLLDKGAEAPKPEGEVEAKPEEEAPKEEAKPSAPDPDILAQLKDAGLRPVKGESREQSLTRINDHYRGRARSHYSELTEIKEQNKQIHAMLEPWLRAQYQAAQAQQQESYLSQVPDKDTDPQGYAIWLAEENLRRQNAREQTDEQLRQQEMQRLEQERILREDEERVSKLVETDEEILDEFEADLDADPEARSAYDWLTQNMINSVKRRFPDATEEQQIEFVRLAQLIDMRYYKQNGIKTSDAIKATAKEAVESAKTLLGIQIAPPQTPPTIVPPKAPGSPVANQVQKESAQARARAVVSPSASTLSPTGEPLDISHMTEDQFVELGLNGGINVDELVKAQYGKQDRWE